MLSQNSETLAFGAFGYLGMEDKIPLDIGLTASSHVPSRIMDLIMEMVLVPTAAFIMAMFQNMAM